jgi:hypothetical protein
VLLPYRVQLEGSLAYYLGSGRGLSPAGSERNIADDRRLAKPAILRSIDADRAWRLVGLWN